MQEEVMKEKLEVEQAWCNWVSHALNSVLLATNEELKLDKNQMKLGMLAVGLLNVALIAYIRLSLSLVPLDKLSSCAITVPAEQETKH